MCMPSLLDSFLEMAYRMALDYVNSFNASKFIVQHPSVIVTITITDVLKRIGISPDDPKVQETLRALFMEKGSGGRVGLEYRDARIEIKQSLTGSGGIRISEFMKPVKWVYVHLPIAYYEQARKRIASQG